MKKWILILLCTLLIALGLYWGFSATVKRRAIIDDYKGSQQLILNDEPFINDGTFILIEGQPYLSLEFIKEKQLLSFRYSGSKKRILFKVDQVDIDYESLKLQHYLRNSAFEVNLPILFKDEGEYVELDSLCRLADVEMTYIEATGRLVLDTKDYKYYTGRVSKDKAALKMVSGLMGSTIEKLPQYEQIRIFKETSEAYKIRLESGLVGYLTKDAIDLIEEVPLKPYWHVDQKPEFKKYYPIGLAWDAIGVYEDNFDKRPTERSVGLDVLSPTWFKITNDGWVLNDADLGYMKAADALNYQVWPLFSNDFDPALTHDMLQSDKKRRQVVAQLIQYAAIYGFGGINVDFENVYLADQDLMTQFVKELSKEMKRMNLVLSIDVTVPWGSDQWSKFVDRKAIEPFVDYFMLMAYDEHWASSPKAGSVASLPWVEKGVLESLKLIPKEKLLLGIPLYMRVWTEHTENGKLVVSSKTLSIKNTETFLKDQLHLKSWDSKTGQSTIEYKEDGDVKKVWLEDEESLTLKLQIMRDHELAGAAAWRKGFESPWLWPLMEKMLKR